MKDVTNTTGLLDAGGYGSSQNTPVRNRKFKERQSDNTITRHTVELQKEKHNNTYEVARAKTTVLANATRQVVELSSDENDSFDDFDDSLFDQIVLPAPPKTVHPQNKNQNSSVSCIAWKNTPVSTVLKNEPVNKNTSHPNGAFIPPFMHPCLKDSYNSAVNHELHVGSHNPGLMLTCFRVAEALCLKSAFKSGEWPPWRDIKIALFGTVHEVKHADSYGSGQGLVFSDIFFPHKPPYISAVCKMPYNTKQLTGDTWGDQASKPLVKAVIRISTAGKSELSQSRMPSRWEKISQDPTNLEVLDVHLSS